MKKTLAVLATTVAATAGFALSAAPANAGHCADTGPGHSDFGGHAAAQGPGAHNEGDHKGWSSCIPGNPNFGFVR